MSKRLQYKLANISYVGSSLVFLIFFGRIFETLKFLLMLFYIIVFNVINGFGIDDLTSVIRILIFLRLEY